MSRFERSRPSSTSLPADGGATTTVERPLRLSFPATPERIESLREVKPHVSDAWIDENKRDARDGQIGIVGYEIPLTRHSCEYKPPRPLEDIVRMLAEVTA